MMTESETKQSALAHFDRTPIAPHHVRVLVQSGVEWYWHEMPAGEVFEALKAFERAQLNSLRPKPYTELGCQKVSVLLMSSCGRGDDYEACMASLWLLFRRPNEKANKDPALMSGLGAAITGYPAGHVEGYPDTFRGLFAAVYADVAAGRPSADPAYPTFADGHDVMLVCDAVVESAQSRTWAPVRRSAS